MANALAESTTEEHPLRDTLHSLGQFFERRQVDETDAEREVQPLQLVQKSHAADVHSLAAVI